MNPRPPPASTPLLHPPLSPEWHRPPGSQGALCLRPHPRPRTSLRPEPRTLPQLPAARWLRLSDCANPLRIRCLPPPCAVSYTHLRAHETKANLVCRLLLE